MRLFEAGYKESGGKCGLYGEIVCWCLANRVRRHMGNWSEVLTNIPKYRANEPPPVPEIADLWNPQVQKLMQEIDNIYDNAGEDKANGGIYWIFTERGVTDWFREFVINNKSLSCTAIQNSLKVYGEATIIGKDYDPRMAGAAMGGRTAW